METKTLTTKNIMQMEQWKKHLNLKDSNKLKKDKSN